MREEVCSGCYRGDRGQDRGLTAGLRFDVVKNFKRKNPASYARLVIHQWGNGVDNTILTHIALRRTL